MKYYSIYTRVPGQEQYHPTDMGRGVQADKVRYASVWSGQVLARNLNELKELAELYPFISFQVREMHTGRVRWSSPTPPTAKRSKIKMKKSEIDKKPKYAYCLLRRRPKSACSVEVLAICPALHECHYLKRGWGMSKSEKLNLITLWNSDPAGEKRIRYEFIRCKLLNNAKRLAITDERKYKLPWS